VNTGRQELGVAQRMGRYTDPRAPLKIWSSQNVNGSPIRLRGRRARGRWHEGAGVRWRDSTACRRSRSRFAGSQASNTIDVINGIKRELPRLTAQLPQDVKMDVIRGPVRATSKRRCTKFKKHLVLGYSILASLVVLLFMRSWRSTLIAAGPQFRVR